MDSDLELTWTKPMGYSKKRILGIKFLKVKYMVRSHKINPSFNNYRDKIYHISDSVPIDL